MLREQAIAGLDARLDKLGLPEEERGAYRERLTFELDIIIQMGFPGYFLIVADFIKWAKGQDIPVGPGRGSGAGSVVAWALTITDLDPLKLGLLFERFLNPERVSMRGLRHRLLQEAPSRRGDPLCAGQIWRGPCRADHHLRHIEGPRRYQGYRARARNVTLWPGRPARQAGAQPPDRPVDDRPRAQRHGPSSSPNIGRTRRSSGWSTMR